MKSKDEVEEMRDRLGDLATRGVYPSGSTRWQKIEAAEAVLGWVLGELEGFPGMVSQMEKGEPPKPPVDLDGNAPTATPGDFGFPLPRTCPECGSRPVYRIDGEMVCYDCGSSW